MEITMPFNALPLISTIYVEESKELLRLAEDTRVALSVLDYAIKRLPNDAIVLDNLLLQEAKCSSAVENIVTTNDELYKGLSLSKMTPAVKEVASYKEGLFLGYTNMQAKANLLSISDIIAINSTFNNREQGLRKNLPGLASSLTRIASVAASGEQTILYTPPHGLDLLNRLMMDLLEFIYDDERFSLHPLIKIALAHYQFECIHPFHDGNGRTGRILNILFLCNKGYLSKPYLYASAFIIKNKNEYYALLNDTTKSKQYDEVVKYMLTCFCQTAQETLALVEEITALYQQYTSGGFLKGLGGNKENLRTAIRLAFVKTYIRTKDLEDAGMHRQTASAILNSLVQAGFLQVEQQVGNSKQAKIYKNMDLLNLFGGTEQ